MAWRRSSLGSSRVGDRLNSWQAKQQPGWFICSYLVVVGSCLSHAPGATQQTSIKGNVARLRSVVDDGNCAGESSNSLLRAGGRNILPTRPGTDNLCSSMSATMLVQVSHTEDYRDLKRTNKWGLVRLYDAEHAESPQRRRQLTPAMVDMCVYMCVWEAVDNLTEVLSMFW